MANDDRRVNMYFSDKKYIDDAIYQHFKDMPNKQDIMKMVLYEYVKGKNVESNNFVTKTTQDLHSNNTKTTQKGVVTKTAPKVHKNVTKNTQENHENVTKITPISEEAVTKDTQISDFKTRQQEMRKKSLTGLNYFNKKG
ncbi:hypothetical protein [Clostridium tagluense]|uniref:hypothetical protein n=1 Tax=Clostridium tagluense TaxID=360422 RepID=UPI001CF16126|nr:hypothetical protein [Clostridium tagluense]MCB2297067.1 hypothetical protein [Clostridium tagluense]